MVENLAFVLLGLSLVVGALTFVGAHNSPFPMPNISKSGCMVSGGLMVVGFALGLFAPVSHYNTCASQCETALLDMDADHGDFDIYVEPGRGDYKACQKGARQADKKAKEIAAEQGDPSLAEAADPVMVEARCIGQALEHCTMDCFAVR
jgi:hypothetical protein